MAEERKSPASFQTALTRFYYQYAAKIMTSLGVYNPQTITFTALKRMRDYPQIHFGLSIIKLAVLGVEKKVVCDDEDIRTFVEEEYLKPWSRRFAQACLNGLDFGFSPIELVWTSVDYNAPKTEEPTKEGEVALGPGGPRWVLKELRTPDPENCQWLASADGYYNGFVQNTVDFPKVPADKSVWYAYDDEFGNLYGTPATKPSYAPWYNHELFVLYMLREAERFGSPFVKVRHPEDVAGDTTNKSAAETLGRDLKDNSYVALSSKRDAERDYEWDVEVVPAEGTSEHWVAKLDYFNTEMFRALHIPDRVATQGEIGAYKQAEVHKGVHTQNIDGIVWDINDVENEHVVKKLVEYNFDNPPTCYLEAEVLADDKREFILEICGDILKGKADRQVIEAAKLKVEQMGLELPKWEELPEETKPEPMPPELKGKKEPMPAGEGDVLGAEGLQFEGKWVTLKNKAGESYRVFINNKKYEVVLSKLDPELEAGVEREFVEEFGLGPCGAYTVVRREEGWGEVAHVWVNEPGKAPMGHYVNIKGNKIIDFSNQWGDLEYGEVDILGSAEIPKEYSKKEIDWMRKKLKKRSLPKFEAEAPAGWNIEFRQLHADVRADLHKVVDGIETWAVGLDKTVKPYDVPSKREYNRVLEFGALAAFDLAVKAQGQEFGVVTAPVDARADVSDRVGRVVNKQFSSLSFDVGNALAQGRREKFFNYQAEIKDRFEGFRDRVDLAVDTELADAFRIGRDAVISA